MNNSVKTKTNNPFKKPLRKKSNFFILVSWLVIISMIGGGALVTGILDYFSQKDTTWVIKVNDQKISEQEYRNSVAVYQSYVYKIMQQLYQYFGKQGEQEIAAYMQQLGLDQNPEVVVQEQLINFALINEQVKKLHMLLDEVYVVNKLSNRDFIATYLSLIVPSEVLLPDGGINEAMLAQYLKQAAISPKKFELFIDNALKRALFLHMLMTSTYVTKDDLHKLFIQTTMPRSYSLVKIDYNKLIAAEKKNAVVPEEIEQYFNAHQNNYWVAEKRSGYVARFNADSWTNDAGEKIVIPSEKLKEYYEKNKLNEFVAQKPKIQVKRVIVGFEDQGQEQLAKEKAEDLLHALQKNPSLFDSVEKNTQDADIPYTVRRETTDYFARGDKANKDGLNFEKAAFLLNNKGDISALVKTNNGFEILQLIDKKARELKSFEEVEKTIRSILVNKEFKRVFVSNFGGDKVRIDIPEFAASKKAKYDLLENKDNDASPDIQLLFSLKGSEKNKNPYKSFFDGDTGVIIQLKEVVPGYAPTLEAVLDKVKDDIYQERATKRLQEITKSLEKAATLPELQAQAKEFNLVIEKIENLDPKSEDSVKSLEKRFNGFSADAMSTVAQDLFDLTTVGSFAHFQNPAYGYVVRLDNILGDLAAGVDEQNNLLRTQAMREDIKLLVLGYIDSLHKNVKIEMNKNLSHIG